MAGEIKKRVTDWGMIMKQSDIIKQLTDKELKQQLILSQCIIIIIAITLSFFLFDSFLDWFTYFQWDLKEILIYGVIPGLIIVGIDLIIIYLVPKEYYDDGGINIRIFRNQSVFYIFSLSLIVAVSEEMLFRGVIQTTFGYVVASLIFALLHVRYLRKPVLFISVLLTSFYIGYLYMITANLVVTITTHFIVDFLLGLMIRFKKEV